MDKIHASEQYPGSENAVNLLTKPRMRFSCAFDKIRNYPFGTQECSLKIFFEGAANNLTGLGMGSLQNLARGRPGSVGGPPGGMPAMGGGLHSQGLQGRLTPTHFGSRSAVGGLGQGMSLLQTSSANSRNPLFSRKMGYD